MVEGPGATRNGYKANRLIKRRIQDVQCSCNVKIVSSLNDELPWWTDRYLSQVISIGKELFLIFSRHEASHSTFQNNDDVALRLHFGMDGSFQVNTLAGSNRKTYRGHPTLCLTFGDSISSITSDNNQTDTSSAKIHVVETYQTTVSGPINAKIPRTKFDNLSSLDCCSPQFNSQDVLEKMKKNSNMRERTISDVLLDQHIYPGVGNIIKIEGLHDARVHPKQLLSSLSDDQLHLVILKCRSYAMRWLKNVKAPTKSVYNQMICRTCGEASISMQRVGGTDRTTFWCIQCQPFLVPVPVTNESGNDQHQQGGCNSDHMNDNNNNNKHHEATTDGTQQSAMSTFDMYRRVCPTHGPNTLILRRVRNGNNASRIFHSCNMKQCKYFSWADTFFPSCKCRKRAVLLVSKTERTGGKFLNDRWDKFLACWLLSN